MVTITYKLEEPGIRENFNQATDALMLALNSNSINDITVTEKLASLNQQIFTIEQKLSGKLVGPFKELTASFSGFILAFFQNPQLENLQNFRKTLTN